MDNLCRFYLEKPVYDNKYTKLFVFRKGINNLPMCLSTSTIFSIVVGSISGEVIRFSTAKTTPSDVQIPMAVEPSLIASIAYST